MADSIEHSASSTEVSKSEIEDRIESITDAVRFGPWLLMKFV